MVMEQLGAIETAPRSILLEPAARNTAPAILAAAFEIQTYAPKGVMLVLPSDHVIADHRLFQQAVMAATEVAISGTILTFGIAPDRPETGYGYLELPLGSHPFEDRPQPLAGFVEKPEVGRATEMLEAGNFLWNAGIFLMSVPAVIAAYQTHAPDIYASVYAAHQAAKPDLGFLRLDADAWGPLRNVSVDYAIMEKSEDLAVMPYRGEWSDLGGWDAVCAQSVPDLRGTVAGDHTTAIDCDNTLLRSETDQVEIVGLGLKDVMVVATSDAVLVADKSRAQDVKHAVTALHAKGAKQADKFPIDHRPWGWFETLAIGDRFQVKRIVVNPGASLSLQSHVHRAEHWIVVAGTAKVTIEDTTSLVSENHSVYVPLGAKHRLENPGRVPMILIEVQTGCYLGEDDIVRYEDRYRR